MRKVRVLINNKQVGELEKNKDHYIFRYDENYDGVPVSLAMPTYNRVYEFNEFPPFFDGLLPEGNQLEILIRKFKIDRKDLLGQLIQVGGDLVGAITIKEIR